MFKAVFLKSKATCVCPPIGLILTKCLDVKSCFSYINRLEVLRGINNS